MVYYVVGMKLPNGEVALVSTKKIKNYLLSIEHPVGKLKAKFFNTTGFSQKDAKKLEQLLLKIAAENELTEITSSEYGKKYIIEGTIKSSKGKSVRIQTIWIVETGKTRPRFITAYPV